MNDLVIKVEKKVQESSSSFWFDSWRRIRESKVVDRRGSWRRRKNFAGRAVVPTVSGCFLMRCRTINERYQYGNGGGVQSHALLHNGVAPAFVATPTAMNVRHRHRRGQNGVHTHTHTHTHTHKGRSEINKQKTPTNKRRHAKINTPHRSLNAAGLDCRPISMRRGKMKKTTKKKQSVKGKISQRCRPLIGFNQWNYKKREKNPQHSESPFFWRR